MSNLALRCVLGGLLLAARVALATNLTVAVVGLEDDARYQPRRLEHAYPAHPTGRPLDAVAMAIDESALEVEAGGFRLQSRSFMAANPADLPRVLKQLKAADPAYVLLDLPDADLRNFMASAPAVLGAIPFFNIGSGADALRGAGCVPSLLHTYPSEAMRGDALAQFLAANSWNQALVLVGPQPADQLQLDAFTRSARRYGVKIVRKQMFKLSGDPRERDLGNVRLLTSERGYDVVVVLDSDGEFARTLPYNTQWPRPVVGASGLVAQAWDSQWELNGGPQLSRRFFKAAHRPMSGQDWAAWAAIKSIVSVLASAPRAGRLEQLRLLRSGQVYVDGFKGPRLSYRPWDGQLRQPIFLAHGNGVAAVAPMEGVMHPTEVLDTLGFDEKESTCKLRP